MGTSQSSTASPGQSMAVKEFIDSQIGQHKVAIFSKSYCPYCTTTKALFKKSEFSQIDVVTHELGNCVMGVSNNDEGSCIINRRQLLVKVGNFMKNSWRRSREKIVTDLNDDKDDNDIRGRGRSKHNLFVQFDCDYDDSPANSDNDHDEQQQTISEDNNKDGKIEDRWYQSDDYCQFKKDMLLSSLNYMNARRASKIFDENKYSIRGIEHMCYSDPNYHRRQTSERKYAYKVIRDEQNRQKQNCSFPDIEKIRSLSILHTKKGRDRAISRGNEYARQQQQYQKEQQKQQRNDNHRGCTSSPSKSRFLLCR
mmetsp:Transcript_34858/g.39787  ORF Transcript_34858/g.39787 Transcript_34858/m.39787 type:complete len:310 (+) Transcript_34858:77-1006(+)